mmetsp:Transcript_61520/g.146762  ORF Transcript_61520/g.146762 Transcript_61520/m.146762 type:complete len:84 (+) Transcript_61520:73-324(+)
MAAKAPPYSNTAPQVAAFAAPVHVSEADRIEWLRQYLTALEEWKSFLDAHPDNTLESAGEAPRANGDARLGSSATSAADRSKR